nr:NADH dehydrogenase subunit 3 [Actornithophilus hoplopteri]
MNFSSLLPNLDMSSLFLLVSLLIAVVLILISLLFVDSPLGEVSDSPFECGFESSFISRIPFSLHFFTITIVFLIFDLEIVVLLPLVSLSIDFSLISIIIFILLLGLLLEWFDGSLDWLI